MTDLPPTTHRHPSADDMFTPCCNQTLSELAGDRITADPARVTCGMRTTVIGDTRITYPVATTVTYELVYDTVFVAEANG